MLEWICILPVREMKVSQVVVAAIALTVERTASGMLWCEINNTTPFPWEYSARSGVPLWFLSYWNGAEWVSGESCVDCG